MTMEELFGEPIYTYTREQAFDDGVLVDLSEADAAKGCYKWPIACTRAVWDRYIDWEDEDTERQGVSQDFNGRLHDIMWMSRHGIVERPHPSTVLFELRVIPRHGSSKQPQKVRLKLVVHPGDTPAPVITIMLPEED